MHRARTISRRSLLALAGASLARAADPVIDIHQHTDYSGRTDEQLIAHQRTMGITHTILLPAGRFFGLEAGASGNDRVQDVARKHPGEYFYFANEVPYLSGARAIITNAIKAGAV